MTRNARKSWIVWLLLVGCLTFTFHAYLHDHHHGNSDPCPICHLTISPVDKTELSLIERWVPAEPDQVQKFDGLTVVEAQARAPPHA